VPLNRPTGGRGYFDQRFNAVIINVAPGGQELASDAGEVLSTVLGSCVAACLRDPLAGVGGMNHFLLPGEGASPIAAEADDMRFGVASMEVLINALIKRGAERRRMEAKVFGGATMIGADPSTSVGSRNAAFVLTFLAREGIPVAARDLGGGFPRRANYEPATGRAWVNRLPLGGSAEIRAAESAYRQSLARRDPAASLELF
jgi:chemotaxis protein CheD